MKKILIVLPDHFSVRNFIYSPFIQSNFRRNNLEIIFVINNPQSHSKILNDKSNITFIDLASKKLTILYKIKRKVINWLYEALNYRFSKINNLKHISIKENIPDEYVLSGHDRFALLIRSPLPKSKFLYKILYSLYNSSLFSNQNAKQIIQSYKPSIVITTNPQNPETRPYYIEAKKQGIKTFAYINSWDYLTTDGPILKNIDEFLTWNKRMDYELKNIQRTNKPVHNIGPLHFDYSFNDKFVWDKKKTNKFLGLPLDADYFVYGVCGERIGKHEPEVAKYLANKLKKYNIYLVIRGHPEDPSIPNRFKDVCSLDNAIICQGNLFDKEQKIDDRAVLYSLLNNAKVVACGPTTLTLDAIRFDKPTINIGFDGNIKLPQTASIAARYTINHFFPLLSYHGIYYVKNWPKLNNAIENALKNPCHLASGRKKIRENYLKPLDGKASERLFNLLLS